MATNVVLCRWAEGFHEVKNQASIDIYGRREALLALGALSNVEEVERVITGMSEEEVRAAVK